MRKVKKTANIRFRIPTTLATLVHNLASSEDRLLQALSTLLVGKSLISTEKKAGTEI